MSITGVENVKRTSIDKGFDPIALAHEQLLRVRERKAACFTEERAGVVWTG